jgi:hypothetical protein
MARWRQVYNEETGKSEFIPIDEAARHRDISASVHGDIESFVSPVDGSVISDRKQLREHNKRNNVVQTSEFGTEHWDIKRKERERLYNGEYTPAEKQARKMEIHEAIMRAERAN